MEEFRALLTGLGAENVQTYIASGNAIVDLDGDPDVFDRAVESAMEEQFGWFREVMSRAPNEVETALEAYPFAVVAPKFSYIVFLSGKPESAHLDAAQAIDTGDDRWSIAGRDIHLQYANGTANASPGVEKALRRLKVPGTARNLNTVQKVLEMAAGS